MAYEIEQSLPDYVKQNENELLYKSIFGSASVERFSKQLGVKGKAAINILNTDVIFQDGSVCGFTPQGNATFSARLIETGQVKVNMDFCHKTLIGKFTEREVTMNANQEVVPFEEAISNSLADSIKAEMERCVWQGKKETNYFDGILEVLTDAEGVVTVSLSAASAYENILAVYEKIPRSVRRKAGLKINVSPELYDKYIQELVKENYYHYPSAKDAAPMEFNLPGTNVPVISVDGLSGSNKIVAAVDSNIYYGTDMMGDDEVFKFWYSNDKGLFCLDVEWNAGVQVAFPDEVVVGTIA